MADCNSPCSPCCKYGGFRVNTGQKLAEPTPQAVCGSPIQNVEPPQQQPQTPPPDLGLNIDQNRPIPHGDPPCYLPQMEDMPGRQVSTGETPQMGPIGPWATGRVDWGPLAGLTGTRPVVNKYSITRYSEGEWRQRNKDLLDDNYVTQHRANLVKYTADQCYEKTRAEVDKGQVENTKLIEERTNEIHRWKCELERGIEAAIEELNLLDEQHTRLKQAGAILTIPEAIASECIDIRSSRLEPDLVRDEVQEELVKELALTAEIRDIFNRTLKDIEMQIIQAKAAKQRLEFDWSDKKDAFNCETLSTVLNNRSSVIVFQPGATRVCVDQSTPEYWLFFTRESLYQSEQTRQAAVTFRGTLDAILTNAARDLRSQADRVDTALAKRIGCTEELREKLEAELTKILELIVDNEKIVYKLQKAIRDLDFPMKVAQTRLHNKQVLPRVENCREGSAFGLINEIKAISKHVAALNAELKQAEDCLQGFLDSRAKLEREIMIKLKSLWIDKERIQFLRSHYPSTSALSGH